MFELPDDIPVTIPVDEPTVATAVVPLLQVPPMLLLLRVVALPAHNVAVPVLAAGVPFTVITVVRLQPLAAV